MNLRKGDIVKCIKYFDINDYSKFIKNKNYTIYNILDGDAISILYTEKHYYWFTLNDYILKDY